VTGSRRTVVICLCAAVLWGCTGAGSRTAPDEFYERVPGATSWDKRHIHETEHYRIESNCSRNIVEHYGRTLETLYSEWSRYICKPALKRKLMVQIYATREEFQEALNKPDLVRGLYGDGVVITYHGTWGGSSTTESLFHEGTHQLHDACMGIKKAPIWLAEGLARFFERFRSDAQENLYPAFDHDSLRGARWDIDKPPGELLLLLSTPKDKFDVDCYDRAHLLTYFLVNTTKKNREIFDSYWRTLLKKAEEPGSDRFIEILGGKEGVQVFERRWRKWVASLRYTDTPEEARQKALETDKAGSE
jgi:hypothetical protein